MGNTVEETSLGGRPRSRVLDDIIETPITFHRMYVKWAVRNVILKFRGEVQVKMISMEDIIAQNTLIPETV